MSTPAPPPTIEQAVFATTDMSEVKEYLDQAYGWRITVHRPGAAGTPLTVSSTTTGLITSAHAFAPGDLSYQVKGEGFIVIDTLLHGTVEVEHDQATDRYGSGDVHISNHPHADFSATTHDSDVRTVTLPSSLFTEVADAGAEHAISEVNFLSVNPIEGQAQRWRSVSQFLDDLLNNPEAAAAPLLLGPAARLLAATALITFPNTALSDPASRPGQDHRAHPATMRRAITFIESNAHTDIAIADIAVAAHISPRALQYAFRRHLDTTPMAYLRRVRLDAAHRELQASDPARGITVTAIAAKWGFPYPSRFAATYGRAYGQHPNITLHS